MASFISSIEFDVMSPEELNRISDCEIIHPQAFNKNGSIVEGGPCDLRLGSFDNYECKICKETKDCAGHWGFIRLNIPLYNINLIERVKDILDLVCMKCSRLKCTIDERNLTKDYLRKKYNNHHNDEKPNSISFLKS